MKEKFKKIIKNKYFKTSLFFLLGFFILQQSYAVYVDMYNFQQLEKVKNITSSENTGGYKFNSLKDFNNLFKKDIESIKNCYYMSVSEKKDSFVMGFKIESLLYRILYKSNYFVYPKNNLPTDLSCSSLCHDVISTKFIETISHPCED